MDNIKYLAEEELCAVNKELNNLIKYNDNIHHEILRFINSPQKRIRTFCTALYLKSVKAEITPPIINILTIGELIHNASLLHDDIIDGAKTRRGTITIGEKFTPQISILSGDLLLSFATEKLINTGDMNIIRFFQRCTQEMSEAEIAQYLLRGKIPTIEEYIKIAEGKTASLFTAIFMSCALISSINVNKAEYFAKNFGILFQLKNDLETNSAKTDKQNQIFTPKDILGIEKTHTLIDNYFNDVRREIEEFPESIYKDGLRDLLNSL